MTKRPATAVIGCGYWGRNHVRTLSGLGALAAVADADPACASEVAEAHGVEARPVDDVLSDPAIAAVVLALPAEHHAPLALAALDAGKHVLVEKPVALSSMDADLVAARAAGTGLVAMTGHILRYHNAFRAIAQLVEDGAIGSLRHVQSHRLAFGKFHARFDALWDLAPHDLSLVLSLVPGVRPVVTGIPVSVTGGQADMAHLHLAFGGGPSAHVFVSRHHPYGERRVVVTGDRGMLLWDDSRDWPDKVTLFRHKAERSAGGAWHFALGDGEAVPVQANMALTDELDHFLTCIETGAMPLTPVSQGADVVRILEAVTANHHR